MCGIVGAIAERNIVPVLVEGLKRLEYRGYDSAGLAVLQSDKVLGLRRTVGKVAALEEKLSTSPLSGRTHTPSSFWRSIENIAVPWADWPLNTNHCSKWRRDRG